MDKIVLSSLDRLDKRSVMVRKWKHRTKWLGFVKILNSRSWWEIRKNLREELLVNEGKTLNFFWRMMKSSWEELDEDFDGKSIFFQYIFFLFLLLIPYSLNFVFTLLQMSYCCIYGFWNGFLFGFFYVEPQN